MRGVSVGIAAATCAWRRGLVAFYQYVFSQMLEPLSGLRADGEPLRERGFEQVQPVLAMMDLQHGMATAQRLARRLSPAAAALMRFLQAILRLWGDSCPGGFSRSTRSGPSLLPRKQSLIISICWTTRAANEVVVFSAGSSYVLKPQVPYNAAQWRLTFRQKPQF